MNKSLISQIKYEQLNIFNYNQHKESCYTSSTQSFHMHLPLLFFQTNVSAYFLDYPVSTPTLSHKTTGFKCKYLRLRSKDSVEDAFPPVLVLQQEDILDNGGQAGFREGTVQTSFQERRPFPLQRPLAAHITLNKETDTLSCAHTVFPLTTTTRAVSDRECEAKHRFARSQTVMLLNLLYLHFTVCDDDK